MQQKKSISHYDFIKNKEKINILKLFFIFLSILAALKITDNAINKDAWEYGEWLINYQSGFNRRGLIGEIILLFSIFFNHNPQVSYIFLLIIIIFCFYYLNYIFLKKIDLDYFYLIIFFSPLFYFFFIIENGVGIRKEIIFYTYYLFFLFKLGKEKNILEAVKVIYFVPILLLIHEGLFFYLPYLIIPLAIKYPVKNLKKIQFHLGIVFFICLVTMLILYFDETSYKDTSIICKSLRDFAPIRCNEWGPIYALWHNFWEDQNQNSMVFFYLKADTITWLGYLFYSLYSFIPLLIIFKYLKIDKKAKLNKHINFKLLILISLLFSLPLYHIAEDWSRWSSIHYHLITYSLLFFLIEHKISIKNIKLLKIINSFFARRNIVFTFFLIFYLTFISHEENFSQGSRIKLPTINIIKNLVS